MSVKYFVISDVHSYYDEMIAALNKAGYDQNNPEHIFVLCGDAFDRGPKTLETYKFLKSIPKERRILIRGNHEALLRDAVARQYFYEYDASNGTVRTISDMIRMPYHACVLTQKLACEQFAKTKILDWIYKSDEWVNYFEVGKFVMVHSWIPLKVLDKLPAHYIKNRQFEYREDWRNATDAEWEYSTWGCPYDMLLKGFYPEDKVIVCGHWYVGDFHERVERDVRGFSNSNIYFGEHCIALDAGTPSSKRCNVLIIDGDNCYDQDGNLLK